MKRISYFLFLFILSIILSSCQLKKEHVEEPSIDPIIGEWRTDNEVVNNYTITGNQEIIQFNTTQLIVDSIEADTISTHSSQDADLTYIFEISDDYITVYPNYTVKDSSTKLISGGNLAPIKLKK